MEKFDKSCIFFKAPKKQRYEQLTIFPVNKEVELQQLEENKKDRRIRLYERTILIMLPNAAQNLARFLNRTPTIDELTEVTGVSIRSLYGHLFNSYDDLIRAAGLEPNRKSPSPPPEN